MAFFTRRASMLAAASMVLLALFCATAQAQKKKLPPGQVIDLTSWALDLPVRDGNDTTIVTNPALRTFTKSAYFYTAKKPNAVVFKVAAGGYKPASSPYPRTELFEVKPAGATNTTSTKAAKPVLAGWTADSNTLHSLTLTGAVVQFTPVVPEVVIAQVRALPGQQPAVPLLIKVVANQSGTARPTKANNYVTVNYNGNLVGRLTSTYRLGDPYTLRITAGSNTLKVYWQDLTTPKFTFNVSANTTPNSYFNVGAYLQSNLTLGERKSSFAEVWVYNLMLSSTPTNANGTKGASGNGTRNASRGPTSLLKRRVMLANAKRLW